MRCEAPLPGYHQERRQELTCNRLSEQLRCPLSVLHDGSAPVSAELNDTTAEVLGRHFTRVATAALLDDLNAAKKGKLRSEMTA